jgi:soluble lytic murein transglycosylase
MNYFSKFHSLSAHALIYAMTQSKNLQKTYTGFRAAPSRFMLRSFASLCASIVMVLCACSSVSLKRILDSYLQARLISETEPLRACDLWSDISRQQRFPLAKVALLHALETCTADRKDLNIGVEPIEKQFNEPWLREPFLRANLSRAEKTGETKTQIEMNLDLVAYDPVKRLKEERLKKIISLAPDSPAAIDAMKRLKSIAPRYIEKPVLAEYFDVAADFKQARDFDKSRIWYGKIVNTEGFSNWDKLRALGDVRMTYKLEKRTAEFLKASKIYSAYAYAQFYRPGRAWLRSSRNHDLGNSLLSKYLSTQIAVARAVWTENSVAEATLILKKVERDLNRLIPYDESLFTRARIAEEAEKYQDAIRIFDKINLARLNDKDLKSKVQWYRAWDLRKAGRAQEAIVALENVIQSEPDSAYAPRNRFWLAKTLNAQGLKDRANEQYEWLMKNDPTGWYGLLSFRELGLPLPALTKTGSVQVANQKSIGVLGGILSGEESLILEWLIATQEMSIAKDFLNSATISKRASFTEAQDLEYLQLYARTGNYQTLFTRLYELPVEIRKSLLATHPDLLFPQPWKVLVNNAGEAFKVKTELIYAIMRQESSFNPNARSFADAFGLMQLIPEMAKRAQSSTGIKLLHHEDLYQPETNIPLGTAYLRELLAHWKNGFVPAVASYNANENAISSWLKSRYHGNELEFIEDVPYEETRNYIKLVMRNFIFYTRLNSGNDSIPFPEWCLANIQGANL